MLQAASSRPGLGIMKSSARAQSDFAAIVAQQQQEKQLPEPERVVRLPAPERSGESVGFCGFLFSRQASKT